MEIANIGKDRKKRVNGSADLSTIVYGKVPPQARDLEEAILGGIMLERNAYETAIQIVQAHCFYVDSHQRIFQAFDRLFKKHEPIDILTVVNELRIVDELDIIGGAYFVTKLTNSVVSSANIETHCKIVFEAYLKREVIRISGEAIGQAYEDSTPAFDLVKEIGDGVKNIGLQISEVDRIGITGVAMRVLDNLAKKVHDARNNIEDLRSIKTGVVEWDAINGQLFNGGVYVIAARPGMGKGVSLTQLICNMGKKYKVGVLNGEMTNEQLMIRVGCNLKNIDNELWKKDASTITDIEMLQVQEAMEEAQKLNWEIHDKRDIDKCRGVMTMWVKMMGVQVILLDFLTLYKNKSTRRYLNRTEQAEYVMDVLTEVAKDLDVPIIAYAQLNRESVAKGAVREPNLADLKNAGEIEEKAYQVIFLHRPEYYDETAVQDEMGESIKGLMYFIIAKHRDGKLGRIKQRFLPQFSKIEQWEKHFVVSATGGIRYADDPETFDGEKPF